MSVKLLEEFIKNAIRGLQNDEATCYRFDLDSDLAIYIGWSDGYDENDEAVIHNKAQPQYGINAKIGTTEEYLWCDYDYVDMPSDENGVIDTSMTISPDENIEWLATHLLNEYRGLVETR